MSNDDRAMKVNQLLQVLDHSTAIDGESTVRATTPHRSHTFVVVGAEVSGDRTVTLHLQESS